jgi:hypothetical protein
MLESPLGHDQRRQPTADALSWRWVAGIGLAVAVGSAYFLAAQLSLGLLIKPDGVAVFWPAAGISSGVLIALGPRARWPVAAGAMAATVAANLMGDRDIWAATAFAVCNAAEALITAGLIQHYFGAGFSLDRLRQVLGLLAAARQLDVGRRPDGGRIAAVPCRRTIISELRRPDRADRTFACAFDPEATGTVDPGSQSALAGGQPTFFTGGIFHEPSRIVGLVSLGQYRRNINWNLPAGAGNQFDSLSGPGDSFWT